MGPTTDPNRVIIFDTTLRDGEQSPGCSMNPGEKMEMANSLAALGEGARQVECTINGIGERAGNTSLEEVVMALTTRRDFYNLSTGINTRHLYPVSRKLSNVT